MLFHTVDFALFFLAVLAGWSCSASWPRARLMGLLCASLFFYACWDVRYVFLLLFVTALDWTLGLAIDRTQSSALRRGFVVIAVFVNLGILGLWKYTDFFLSLLRPFSSSLFFRIPEPLSWTLPVGISFYTFQGLGYVVDVYRGKHRAFASPWKFTLAKAFFPQLVAGPIVRPSDIVPQFDRPQPLTDERLGRGLSLVLRGLLKKAAADYLATSIVDRVFDLPEQYSTLETLGAVYGYAFQIYGDFSGYTDIAIGCALLLGFDLPANFDHPYQSTSLREFWRRWHISLSSWLRDYLYVSLGGSRGTFAATLRNVFLTMVLGGLWHGASLTFVVWGALHGAVLVVEHLAARLFADREPARRSVVVLFMRWVVTFHIVVGLWVFFRADTFEQALGVFAQLGRGLGGGAANLGTGVLVVLLGFLASHLAPSSVRRRLEDAFVRAPASAQALAIVVTLGCVRWLSAGEAQPFLYFQF
jgi:alginate O-acetyltransferase complex protein AlgI